MKTNWSSLIKSLTLSLFLGIMAFSAHGQVVDISTFDGFYELFKSDCRFQQTHVILPLEIKSIDDIDENNNTIYTNETITNWNCIRFDQLGSNFYFNSTQVDDTHYSVKLTKEGTGILVYYHFKKVDGQWYLYAIDDFSM